MHTMMSIPVNPTKLIKYDTINGVMVYLIFNKQIKYNIGIEIVTHNILRAGWLEVAYLVSIMTIYNK